MEISTSLVAAMAEPLPPDDEELASRRCPSQGSGSREKTIIIQTEPTVGLVVLFTPVDGDVRIDPINLARLTSTLETLVPSCAIEVRYYRRKNLLAMDTLNGQATRTLLGQTTLCGMEVRAFEPRGKASSVGIVRDIDSTLSDSAILGVLRSTVGIRNNGSHFALPYRQKAEPQAKAARLRPWERSEPVGSSSPYNCCAIAYIWDLSTLAARWRLIPLHLSSMRRLFHRLVAEQRATKLQTALQNKPPLSSPPVQAGPALPATEAPLRAGCTNVAYLNPKRLFPKPA
ncbi:hypothetical protein HPB47_023769 [Ixodes persulcatus]|uniref:Uncharacterized protein n=1 Tax=Ixodes persulcatus TaxID=34615 RepID=A0AC60Q625_IXOPE|nr:hypothetical protein HPB47_023769 [Ixodes persulcatus]